MSATKAQAKLLARELSTLRPHIGKSADCELCQLWQKMVFAVTNGAIPSTLMNEFEYACNHMGIWPDKNWTPDQ